MNDSPAITMFGADWCRDCRRAKSVLNSLGVAYTYIDLVEDEDAAEVARDLSGRTNIPVIVYPDQSIQVEPANPDIIAKVTELGLATSSRVQAGTADTAEADE